MKPNRCIIITLLVLLLCGGGCATIGSLFESKPEQRPQGKSKFVIKFPDQAHELEAALDYLIKGKMKLARERLERVSDSPPLKGITDEAIFRLALLHLGDEGVKGVASAQTLLERLKNEFPNSIWTHQAAPLFSFLSGVKNPRDRERELKTLRELNLSLSRDNKELRQNIDRLKNLDLELELKTRH